MKPLRGMDGGCGWRTALLGIGQTVAVACFLTTMTCSGATAQIAGMTQGKEEPKIPKGPTGPEEQQFPFGANWTLVDIDGRPPAGDQPSFTLDDKLRAIGFGGCNTFSMALYPIKGQKLAAGSIAATRKTCGKPIDDGERAFLIGIHSLPTWHLEPNGDLTLKGQNAMRFRRGL